MDLSNFNISTIFMLALAIILAYLAIRFFTGAITRIISISIGIILLIIVLGQFGITIPILTNVLSYFLDSVKVAFGNLENIMALFK